MTTRTMINLKADLKPLYAQNAAAKQPHIVDVPPLNFIMLDGVGDPNTASFYEAIGALNGAAYTLKFAFKKRGIDFPVMPTEGLWWTANDEAFRLDYKANWVWTIMILIPDVVTADDVTEAVTKAKAKKPLPALDLIRLATFHEGQSAQILHIGAYGDAEIPTVERLQRFIAEQGCIQSGKHHEIYLSDPRRAAPEKLKTIIRHPIKTG